MGNQETRGTRRYAMASGRFKGQGDITIIKDDGTKTVVKPPRRVYKPKGKKKDGTVTGGKYVDPPRKKPKKKPKKKTNKEKTEAAKRRALSGSSADFEGYRTFQTNPGGMGYGA